MKYFMLAVTFGVVYGVGYSPEILAIFFGGFSLLYYSVVFSVMAGLKSSSLNFVSSERWIRTQGAATNVISLYTLIMHTSYAYIGFMALPWVLLLLCTTLMGWALHLNIIDIIKKED